jgi:hypothetical protein
MPSTVVFEGKDRVGPWSALGEGLYNLPTKIGLYGEEHPHRDMIGVGIFLCEQDRPRFPRWANQAEAPLLQVALRCVLPDWLAREPDNPYVAVFTPLLIEDDDDLRARAQGLWRTVQDVSLAPEVREILGRCWSFGFSSDFPD